MTLRAMRERAGLSQQDLRAKVGINSISYFWALEAWDSTPRPKRARDPHTMRLDTAKRCPRRLASPLTSCGMVWIDSCDTPNLK